MLIRLVAFLTLTAVTVAAPAAVAITDLVEPAGRIDWSPADGLVAFDRKAADGRYGIWTMDAAGNGIAPLALPGMRGLPHGHLGQPAWHPSGRWLVFQAERDLHPLTIDALTTPGAGLYDDLWVLDRVTGATTRLYASPAAVPAILHPHFSPDGTQLCWAEMLRPTDLRTIGNECGWWRISLASVRVDDGRLVLGEVAGLEPEGPGFYETHGFSPDGGKLIFTTNAGSAPVVRLFDRADICTYDLASGARRRLTERAYNEHAQWSPDGACIVWMSNADLAPAGGDFNLTGSEWWAMRADGSAKRRLTGFNLHGSGQWRPGTSIASDATFSRDGRAFIGYLQRRWFGYHEVDLRVDLLRPAAEWAE
jgi:Tol biopolymer transport system component